MREEQGRVGKEERGREKEDKRRREREEWGWTSNGRLYLSTQERVCFIPTLSLTSR